VCFAASNLCAENAAVSYAVKRKYLNELVEQMGVEPTTSALRRQSDDRNALFCLTLIGTPTDTTFTEALAST
jgi:hypothetical protein